MDQPKRIAGFHFTMSIADNQSSRMWDREQMPGGLEEKQFSGGKYAKFIHKGTTEAQLATYGYIWAPWTDARRLKFTFPYNSKIG